MACPPSLWAIVALGVLMGWLCQCQSSSSQEVYSVQRQPFGTLEYPWVSPWTCVLIGTRASLGWLRPKVEVTQVQPCVFQLNSHHVNWLRATTVLTCDYFWDVYQLIYTPARYHNMEVGSLCSQEELLYSSQGPLSNSMWCVFGGLRTLACRLW